MTEKPVTAKKPVAALVETPVEMPVVAPEVEAPVAAPEPAKPQLVEVELLRKYCPRFLVDDEGNVTEQNGGGTLVTFPAGTLLKLPREEAVRVMRHENHIARPSEQAFG